MRALLVNPSSPESYWSGVRSLRFAGRRCLLPPLGLLTVAALLPPRWRLELADENVAEIRDERLRAADVAMLTGMLVQRDALQTLLARCRALGVRTVVGGPYATTFPEDLAAADHVAVGEGEQFVPRLAADLEAGTAARVYRAEGWPDLLGAPPPRFDLLPKRVYRQMAIQFSRGCPFDCEFCDVVRLYGRRPRTKSPRQFVAELEALRATGFRGDVFVVDDNFVGDRAAARAALAEVARWRRGTRVPFRFYTQAGLSLADDPPLADAMVAAGFDAVFVGVETPNPQALREAGKPQNLRAPLERIESLRRRGLEVWGGFILGFDADGPDIFDRLAEFVERAAIPYAMVGLLGALPGTRLYRRLAAEGRLRADLLWRGDQFGVTNVIHRLPLDQLLVGYRRVMERLYSPEGYFARCRESLRTWSPARGVPHVHLSWDDLRAGLRSFVGQGIKGPYRRSYLRFLAWALAHRPSKLPRALTMAAVGHHFIEFTSEKLVPALEAARLALEGEAELSGPCPAPSSP